MEASLYMESAAMQPLFPGNNEGLTEMAVILIRKSSGLGRNLHETTRNAVSKLIEPMNSYYSNLIEGHKTHPLDIERALKKDYSDDRKTRLLQNEARAHVLVERKMRERLRNESFDICNRDFLEWLHGEFYKEMPGEFWEVKSEEGRKTTIIPGKIREPGAEVKVGRHTAPAATALDGFLKTFRDFYSPVIIKNPVKRIIAIAASHHRLAWIHPFLDGNGRVVRLFTEAYLVNEKVDGKGLWSISRGMSRKNKEYFTALHNADQKRLNDYDGRGNLSDKLLTEFCYYFLETAIDQIDYMTGLLQLDDMINRIDKFVKFKNIETGLRIESKYVLREAFIRGTIKRGEVERLTGKSENTARKIMKKLLELELLTTDKDDNKAPLNINYPVKFAPYFFPGLYPEDIEATLL